MTGISSLKRNNNSGVVNTYVALGISSGLQGCIPQGILYLIHYSYTDAADALGHLK